MRNMVKENYLAGGCIMYSNDNWWERLLSSWEKFVETVCNLGSYSLIALVTIAISVYAEMQILKLPHPDTFGAYLKFMFSSPDGYWGTCLLTLIAFGFCVVLAAATIGWGTLYWGKLNTVLCSLILLLGALIAIWGFYILSYFILLFGVILTIGVIIVIFVCFLS